MKPLRKMAAFSLVEVICAILILGIALVGLTQGITTALTSSKESEIQTTAALLAAGRIETIRADGFVTDGEDEGDGDQGLSLYHWRQSFTSTSIDGLHDVKLVVENSKSGQEIYELRTLLFDAPAASSLDTVKDPKDSKKRKDREGRQR